MKPILASALLTATLFCSLLVAQPPALLVTNAWVRKPPAVDVASVYLSLSNTGKRPVVIVAVRSTVATHVMMHETTALNGQSQMRMKEQLVVAPGQTLNFSPGGLHIMLSGLKSDLSVGQTIPLVLLTADGAQVAVAAVVKPLSAH